MLKAVIFDMDGVLIDSEPLHFSAIKTVLNEYGINVGDEYLSNFVGDTNERLWTVAKEEFELKESIDFYIAQQLQHTITCLKEGDYTLIDGIPALLQELQNNHIPMAIASSSPPVVISAIIEKTGIQPYIDEWVSGNEVAESKPAPYIYLKAAARLGLQPAACVAIEDSYYGVTAAKAAGLKCIGYKNPAAPEQDLSQADWIVADIKEISLGKMKKLF